MCLDDILIKDVCRIEILTPLFTPVLEVLQIGIYKYLGNSKVIVILPPPLTYKFPFPLAANTPVLLARHLAQLKRACLTFNFSINFILKEYFAWFL